MNIEKASQVAACLAAALLVLSVAVLALALFGAGDSPVTPADRSRGQFDAAIGSGFDLQQLLARIAGRQLIRPAQVQAAVKDTGAAQRLLMKLNLQGVVQMRGELVAYVGVQGGSVQTVKKGEKLLEFVVESIEPSRVLLSLDGVQVDLGH